MTISDTIIQLDAFSTFNLGIIVLFAGRRMTLGSRFLRQYSIPEPVSGGLLVSIAVAFSYLLTGYEITFDLAVRDVLLVYFFTTIGINASLKDLLKGGMPLTILLGLTIGYMVLQNIIGISIAQLFTLPKPVGLLGGSVSLIGGHGTAIAWAPRIESDFGISNAMEIGVACATFGLILASLMGGPIASFLIKKHQLTLPTNQEVAIDVERNTQSSIDAFQFLDAMLAIHIVIVLGYVFNEALLAIDFQLPLFVTCLFAGIVMTNLVPKNLPTLTGTAWPARKPAVALIADISLGAFLAMSLMSMQLWTLVELAWPLLTILFTQFIVAILVNIYVVFPLMGKNYDAAVVCAGFGGISLGSTPTAMANMSAVTQRYGHSHLAFVIVPLVCAFFIDLANAMVIPWLLG
ncbi:sodium/glutamate symporter [Thaumasiovibrio subtropicus]|uniref:sodium/glutamate symporter n=1 Tax=Thaumasiovibrio subtropicus TaxID=1891207 RepID=UPI000B3585EA|nr:sodium/glutamate symporter [Thaumasiovibrio subtropicus]